MVFRSVVSIFYCEYPVMSVGQEWWPLGPWMNEEPRVMQLGNAGDKCEPLSSFFTSCGFTTATLIFESHCGEGLGKEPWESQSQWVMTQLNCSLASVQKPVGPWSSQTDSNWSLPDTWTVIRQVDGCFWIPGLLSYMLACFILEETITLPYS